MSAVIDLFIKESALLKRISYLEQVKPFIDKDVVKVLIGMRRSGKSTLLTQIKDLLIEQGVSRESILEMNFESAQYDNITSSYKEFYNEVIRFSKKVEGRVYLFFDEIQAVDSWERAISALRVDVNCDIYLTGSNARLLAGELATLLSGRYVTFEVMPFSLREVNEVLPEERRSQAFSSFRTVGGLPFLAHLGFAPQESLVYLSDVYNSIILKDIAQRKGFRDVDQLERVLSYFVSEIGTSLSVKNIANVFAEDRRPVARETIYNYLAAAEEAMLFSRVKRFDVKGKDIIRGNEKVYLTDIGLREALFRNNARRVDVILENLVFNELKRRGFKVAVGKNGHKEIDFIAIKGADTQYVQVTYLLAQEETVKREFGAFEGIRDNHPKLVLSMDTIDFSQDGIRHMNIEEFLNGN
jgi:predicted AAA+ superfamily ATPase